MNVMITGSTGFLGSDLNEELSKYFECYGVGGRNDFPLTDADCINNIILSRSPQIIVHAAGWHSHRVCEEEPRSAFKVNALGTRNVALAANEVGASVIYLSTHRVFSGENDRGYYEFDYPEPGSVLGWSKWWGEYYVRQILNDYCIIRLPMLFSLKASQGRNPFLSAMDRARSGDEIVISEGPVTNPTWTRHVAEVIGDLIITGSRGLYHVGGTGVASMPQFMRVMLESIGLNPALVKTKGNKQKTGKKTIPNGVIQSAALPYIKGVRSIPGWREALKECMKG